MSSRDLLLKARRTAENSGMAFIGGLNDNFQLIIKCPIHAYGVIKKILSTALYPPECRFYSGSVEIEDVALSQFHGIFSYRNDKGKIRKFKAAFVYPLMADYMVSEDEFSKIQSLCATFQRENFSYYDKNNRSIQALFNCFALPAIIPETGLESAFCCVKATKVK